MPSFFLDLELSTHSVFITLVLETFRFEADALEGGCNGKKQQHFFLLQGFFCCTEPQMGVISKMGCDSSTVE